MKKCTKSKRIKKLSDKAFKLQCEVDELVAEVYALDAVAGEDLEARIQYR